MRNVDFSSWHSALITVIGLVLLTLLGVGIRLAPIDIQNFLFVEQMLH